MKLGKTLALVCSLGLVIATVTVGVLYFSYKSDRLDLTNSDDLYTLGKNVGFRPKSDEIYVHISGFVDYTTFYKARVRPEEIGWLDKIPEVVPFAPPRSAPFWWRVTNSGKKYYRTNEKRPSMFIYDAEGGWLYGLVDSD